MFSYALLNKENIVVGISHLSGEVNAPNMVRLTDEPPNTGDKYENGKFNQTKTSGEIETPGI